MALCEIGTAILLNGRTSRRLSVSEWEELHDGVGFLQDEWWFKAGRRLAVVIRAAVAGALAVKRRRPSAIPEAGPEFTRT